MLRFKDLGAFFVSIPLDIHICFCVFSSMNILFQAGQTFPPDQAPEQLNTKSSQ